MSKTQNRYNDETHHKGKDINGLRFKAGTGGTE